MRIRVAVPEESVDSGVIDAALEAVTRLDEDMIRKGTSPTADQAIAMGAVWKPEPPGDEYFDHGGTIAARGWGDCDDWAPLGAATLRASGEDPGATAVVIPSGPLTYHAVVKRSDGTLEDPSVAAGMKPLGSRSVSGAPGYGGALLPTTGPLSLHCGIGMAIRGIVLPDGPYYEARIDTPLAGSPLLAVRGYMRRNPRAHRGRGHRSSGPHVMGGVVPYAIACIGHGDTALEALDQAIIGAVLCGDAAGMQTSLDRYKLLAMQAGARGLSPGQTRDLLQEQISQDLQAAAAQSGLHPQEHSRALLAEIQASGARISGSIVGGFFDDIAKAAGSVVSSVSSAVNSVAHVVSQVPWGDIIHDAQAVVSLVPGLGTAVSDVVAAAETAYESAADLIGGHPIDAAIDAAYNFALASIPGASALRSFLDPAVHEIKKIIDTGQPPNTEDLLALLNVLPSSPDFGGLNPHSVAASLLKLVTSHMGVKSAPAGGQPAPKPAPKLGPVAAHAAWSASLAASKPRVLHPGMPPGMRPAHPGRRPAPPPQHARRPAPPMSAPQVAHPVARAILAVKPPGIAHAGVHVDDVAFPGSPGAPAGATHWTCIPTPDGTWHCRWL